MTPHPRADALRHLADNGFLFLAVAADVPPAVARYRRLLSAGLRRVAEGEPAQLVAIDTRASDRGRFENAPGLVVGDAAADALVADVGRVGGGKAPSPQSATHRREPRKPAPPAPWNSGRSERARAGGAPEGCTAPAAYADANRRRLRNRGARRAHGSSRASLRFRRAARTAVRSARFASNHARKSAIVTSGLRRRNRSGGLHLRFGPTNHEPRARAFFEANP